MGDTKALTRKADALWSKAIRLRDPICRWCGKNPTKQAHHIFGRRSRNTRWCLDNGIGICFGCHLKGHENPMDLHDHIRGFMGADRYDLLRMASKIAAKIDVNLMILALGEEIRKIEGRMRDGLPRLTNASGPRIDDLPRKEG